MYSTSPHAWSHGRPGSSGTGRVGTKHADSGSEFGATQRDHVLSNMSSHDVAMLRAGVGQDVLDQVVAVLITGNINEWNARSVGTAFADTIQVSTEKLGPANLQALLDNLGGELVRAVLGSVSDDVVDGTTPVCRGAVLANVLDAPVAKLPVGNNVNVGEYFLDTGSLQHDGLAFNVSANLFREHTLSSSRQFSKMFWTTKLPVSPRATSCHMSRRASLTYFMIWGGESVQRSSKSFCQTWHA